MTTLTKLNINLITQEELYQKINGKEEIQLVNVLYPKDYLLGIIKGSKKIPLDQLDYRLKELDENKEVITYCTGYDCDASIKAAEILVAKGFRVSVYEGGINEWKEAGLPIE